MKPRWIVPFVLLLASLQVHAAASPVWVVDPARSGPSLPPKGVSLFDVLTSDGKGRREVPFPFERLVARIEARNGCDTQAPCTRTVLIPLGRSLQRTAAAPDFFAHPRMVTAVVADGRGPQRLRDRLYLGYQDRADLIEVISYNETLGRFEFQLVKNYQAGATPEVVYAQRAMCAACHQNQAPIFSRQVWLETNANPAVAARLAQARSTFHGVAAHTTVDVANAIDDATDRANRLAFVQQLWREGCGAGATGDRCRRTALIAALQYGLTGQRAYARTLDVQRDVAGAIARSAHSRWPSGLAIPNPDIPNRDPFAFAETVHSSLGLAQTHVPARFEPLAPRLPVEVLTVDGTDWSAELVRGLSRFWSRQDFIDLDAELRRVSGPMEHVVVPCLIERGSQWIHFQCASDTGSDAGKPVLAGTIEDTGGTLDALAADGHEPVRNLDIAAVDRSGLAQRSVRFEVRDGARAARGAGGDSIASVALSWGSSLTHGQAEIVIRHDFTRVVEHVQVPDGPVRSPWVGELTASLRGAPPTATEQAIPPPQVESRGMDPAPAAVPFEAQCGACHRGSQISPPNFLYGDAKRVQRALASCAPRMFVRLAMNDVAAGERDKTPMPPERVTSAHASATRGAQNQDQKLESIRTVVESLLRREYGRLPTPQELLDRGYENLRPCLPAGLSESHAVEGI